MHVRSLALQRYRPLALLGFFLILQFWSLDRTRKTDSALIELPAQHVKLNPELFKASTFGHLPAAVDWLVLRFLVDPAYARVTPGTRAPAYYLLDLATELDPFFFDLYVLGGSFLAVVRDDAEGARLLLERGEAFRRRELQSYPPEARARFWPSEWQIPMTLGYVYIYELGDLVRGAEHFLEASKVPGAPPFLSRFAERLRQPDGLYQIGRRLLKFMLEGSRDGEARVRTAFKLRSLEVSHMLFLLNRGFEGYRGARRATPELFRSFLKENGMSEVDPWGGTLALGQDGKIQTSTPRQRVLGLE